MEMASSIVSQQRPKTLPLCPCDGMIRPVFDQLRGPIRSRLQFWLGSLIGFFIPTAFFVLATFVVDTDVHVSRNIFEPFAPNYPLLAIPVPILFTTPLLIQRSVRWAFVSSSVAVLYITLPEAWILRNDPYVFMALGTFLLLMPHYWFIAIVAHVIRGRVAIDSWLDAILFGLGTSLLLDLSWFYLVATHSFTRLFEASLQELLIFSWFILPFVWLYLYVKERRLVKGHSY